MKQAGWTFVTRIRRFILFHASMFSQWKFQWRRKSSFERKSSSLSSKSLFVRKSFSLKNHPSSKPEPKSSRKNRGSHEKCTRRKRREGTRVGRNCFEFLKFWELFGNFNGNSNNFKNSKQFLPTLVPSLLFLLVHFS